MADGVKKYIQISFSGETYFDVRAGRVDNTASCCIPDI
jgi:hypothetical protein